MTMNPYKEIAKDWNPDRHRSSFARKTMKIILDEIISEEDNSLSDWNQYYSLTPEDKKRVRWNRDVRIVYLRAVGLSWEKIYHHVNYESDITLWPKFNTAKSVQKRHATVRFRIRNLGVDNTFDLIRDIKRTHQLYMDKIFEKLMIRIENNENHRECLILIKLAHDIKQRTINRNNWNMSKRKPWINLKNENTILVDFSDELAEGKWAAWINKLVALFEECLEGSLPC